MRPEESNWNSDEKKNNDSNRESGNNPKPERTNDYNRERPAYNSERPRTSSSYNRDGGSSRPYNSDRPARPSYNSDRPARPAYNSERSDRPAYNSDRPARPSYNSDRPARPSYNSERSDRPAYNSDRPARPSYNSDRPARPAYNSERSDRPAYNSDRPARPSFNSDRSARPSYNSDRPERPAYNSDRSGGFNRNFNRNDNDKPTWNATKPSGDSDTSRKPYNRPDNQEGSNFNSFNNDDPSKPRRPRFRVGEGPQEGGESSSFTPRSNNGEQRSGGYQGRPSFGNREGGSSRPSFGSREGGSSRPSFGSREGGSREGGYQGRPSFGNREGGSSRPSFGSRDGGSREGGYQGRSSFGSREGGSREGGYDPNAKYSKKKQFEFKEKNIDPNEPIRLNKYLANAGLCSRREADEFLQAGVVSVNGAIVTELGTKVKREDKVMFHDQLVSLEHKVYVLLNKPKDCVTTTDDPQERLTVMHLVRNACNERIYPVGRLDRNTTGVLLLTNDGELASKLTHPKFVKKKIYQVTLDKSLTAADMEKIREGIELEDGEIHADDIHYVKDEKKTEVGIEIHSGRNRIVRRIFEQLGYKVYKLDRVYFAGLTKKGIPRGKFRHLNDREVNMLLMGAFD